jgi:hypothetical protein
MLGSVTTDSVRGVWSWKHKVLEARCGRLRMDTVGFGHPTFWTAAADRARPPIRPFRG